MTDQGRRLAEPAISVDGLWQVFGDRAKPALTELLHPGAATVDGVARQLREKGLVPAVQDVSFDVAEGEVFVVLGLSGAGKSTLIRCISRLIEPTTGVVRMKGEDILTASKRRMIELRRDKLGMVFQQSGLFPHMTVAENVAFPIKMKGAPLAECRVRAMDVIERVGLTGCEDAYPRDLSGGQQQRVGIARSLAVNPDVWFLDEPFSALDLLARRQLQDEFLSIQADFRKSIVFVTEDIGEALKLADRIAVLRDGMIVQIGTPTEIVLNPVDDFVHAFSRDIPQGRHVTLESLMSPVRLVDGLAEGGPVLHTGMSLDAALSACAQSYDTMAVRDGDGQVVGIVEPEDLARAVGEAAAS